MAVENIPGERGQTMEGDTGKQTDLKTVLINTTSEAAIIIKEIEKGLLDCANLFRVEPSDKVFNLFAEMINNLNQFFDFVRELRSGITNLKDPKISPDFLAVWDDALNIFKEMLAAFENKDWVTLSDLIQYELNPRLSEGGKQLVGFKERFG
ncbi:MAG: hypothetical protein HY758_02695 [Nitrospirae bacterium]|nr:hypothetical protein [Nitrospirota bacterium]